MHKALVSGIRIYGMLFFLLTTSGCQVSIKKQGENKLPTSLAADKSSMIQVESSNTAINNPEALIGDKEKWQYFISDSESRYYLALKAPQASQDKDSHYIVFKRIYYKTQQNERQALPFAYEEAQIRLECKPRVIIANPINYYEQSGSLVNAAISTGSLDNYPMSIKTALLQKYCPNNQTQKQNNSSLRPLELERYRKRDTKPNLLQRL